jgi:hypothetical protein
MKSRLKIALRTVKFISEFGARLFGYLPIRDS